MFVKEKPDRKKKELCVAFLFLRFLSNGRRQRRVKKRPQQKTVFAKQKKYTCKSLLKELHLRDTESHFRSVEVR